MHYRYGNKHYASSLHISRAETHEIYRITAFREDAGVGTELDILLLTTDCNHTEVRIMEFSAYQFENSFPSQAEPLEPHEQNLACYPGSSLDTALEISTHTSAITHDKSVSITIIQACLRKLDRTM
jgi:hypothetical protein